jgi:hypothetical protein
MALGHDRQLRLSSSVLFHGGKTPEDPRDARLVEASHTIVLKLIEPLVGSRLEEFVS